MHRALFLALVLSGAPLSARAQCLAEAEGNDAPGTAQAIGAGCVSGAFAASDQEFLALDVAEAALWSLDLSLRGAALDLFPTTDPAGTPGPKVLRLDGGVSAADTLLTPGRWLLGLSNAGGAAGDWRLTVTETPLAPPAAELAPGGPPLSILPAPGTAAVLPLDLSPADARRRWTLQVASVPGAMVQLTLSDADGRILTDAARIVARPVGIEGLGLDAGRYLLTLRGLASEALPMQVSLAASGPRLPVREDEPNDRAESARPLPPGRPVTGRLAEGDVDLYRVAVTDEARLLTISAEADPGPLPPTLSLCLKDAAGVDRQCRSGAAPELGDLALPAGDWLVGLSGNIPGGGDYRLALRPGPPRATRGGQEPNDTAADARPLAPGTPETGAFAGQESDRFALVADGAPQLWRIEATGATLLRVEDAAGLALVTRYGTRDDPLVAEDLYLPAGRYVVALDGDDSAYTLLATPTGTPAPGREAEPNDTPETATLLPPGGARSGRIAGASDIDRLRFTLDRDGPMILTLDLPEGGEAFAQIEGPGGAGTEILPATGLRLEQDWPAGEYAVSLSQFASPDPLAWTARLDWGDPLGPAPAAAGLRLDGALPADRIAAYWPWGQRIAADLRLTAEAEGDFTLDGATAFPGASVRVEPADLHLTAGASATVRLTLDLPADLRMLDGVPVSIRARGPAGEARLLMPLSTTIDAPAVQSRLALDMPETMRGGFDIALPGFGGRFPAEEGMDRTRPTPDNPTMLTDGLAPPQTYVSPPAPFALRLDFGAAAPVPVAGVALTPAVLMTLPYQSRLATFELALSRDGTAFTPALRGELGALSGERFFALESPVPAVAAELRFLSGSGGTTEGMALAEWAVIAAPGWPEGTSIDLADPARGGHVARAVPLMAGDEAGLDALLLPGDSPTAVDTGGTAPEIVVGFAASRSALVSAIEWQENAIPLPVATAPWPAVVAWGGDSPVGPWTRLGDLPPGPLRRLDLSPPVALRYARLTPAGPMTGPLQPPARIGVFEAPVAPERLSAAGWWGMDKGLGPLDTAPPPLPGPAGDEDRDSASSPGRLAWGGTVAGRVTRGADTDHWSFTVPEGETRAALSLTGQPSVLARLTLADAAGKPAPLRRLPSIGGEALWEAQVTPGSTYQVTVDEPPRNVVMAVDVSGSLQPFWSPIRAGLSAMAETMVPGRDFVRILPFEQEPVGEWTDDPIVLRQVLAGLSGLTTGSGAETTVLKALDSLAGREGTKAIVLMTDGATSGFADRPAMWLALDGSGVQVFTAHVGGWDSPRDETRLLQDLARMGGVYAHLQTQSGIDSALARVSAWTRRPADYGLSVGRSTAPPPEPGTLRLTRQTTAPAGAPMVAAGPAPAEGGTPPPAVELILDASGSMLQRIGDGRRVDLARDALRRIVTSRMPPGQPVALRVFGDSAAGSCDTMLRLPLMPLAPDLLLQAVNAAEPVNLAKTPIAASLEAAGRDLAAHPGRRVIVLLTDGEETCGGDPEAAIDALRAGGVEVTVNIVGLAVEDPALDSVFSRWAERGGGRYIPADDAATLEGALAAAMGERFVVRAAPGAAVVATGLVGGPPVDLPARTWFVEVENGGAVWPAVEIAEGAAVTLPLPDRP